MIRVCIAAINLFIMVTSISLYSQKHSSLLDDRSQNNYEFEDNNNEVNNEDSGEKNNKDSVEKEELEKQENKAKAHSSSLDDRSQNNYEFEDNNNEVNNEDSGEKNNKDSVEKEELEKQENKAKAHSSSLGSYNTSKRINEIIVTGNKFTSLSTILNHTPYKKGEIFNPIKTRQLINNVYKKLRRLRSIKVKGEDVSPELMNLHIIVEEKIPLKEINFKGNSHLSEREIYKKIDLNSIYALDPEELKPLALRIKNLYVEKGYNHVDITPALDIDTEGRGTANFIIKEGRKSTVKRVCFKGNNFVSRKELKGIILTKEDWVLGFMDRSGVYHPEMVEYGDRQEIEHYYQNLGFMNARVKNIDIDVDSKTRDISITYEIEEGERYVITELKVEGNDILPCEYLLSRIPLCVGMWFSRERITGTIKALERIWGNKGYIFAHIEPTIIPDDKTKTVSVSFSAELGKPIMLNRINIRGNRKTRDKIIRRKIALEEGCVISQDGMDISKRNIEALGYFDPRDGVNLKVKRLDEENANLDVIVNETKTGHLGLKFGFGGTGDIQSPASDFSVTGDVTDSNLFGSGIQLNTNATWSKAEQSFVFHIAQPWLWDKPILGAFDVYHRRPTFDELRNIMAGNSRAVHEKLTGASLTGGYITRSSWEVLQDLNIIGGLGVDSITYTSPPHSNIVGGGPALNSDYQKILNKSFAPGEFLWVSTTLEQDTRNHPMHANHGHRWRLTSRFAIPTLSGNIGYYKFAFDVNWYTPLINEHDLVLKLHGYAGIAKPFKNKIVPFGELYHIGGPSSVRGYLFGQIGPRFAGDSIGSEKAFFINAELIVPIMHDMSMKGVAFYDGGSGWDNPYTDQISSQNCSFLVNNGFTYRHTVGVGLRILKPMPMRIDWGFKIDPRKNKLDPTNNETPYEVHFGMTYDW